MESEPGQKRREKRMIQKIGKHLMKGIAVLGVLLMGLGFYVGAGPDAGLWCFLGGLLLIVICAISSRELRKFVRSLLDFI